MNMYLVNMIINGICLHFTVYQYGMIQGWNMADKYKILFTIPNFDTAGAVLSSFKYL